MSQSKSSLWSQPRFCLHTHPPCASSGQPRVHYLSDIQLICTYVHITINFHSSKMFHHTYVHVHAHTEMHTQIHTHARTHARTHTHTHTHTFALEFVPADGKGTSKMPFICRCLYPLHLTFQPYGTLHPLQRTCIHTYLISTDHYNKTGHILVWISQVASHFQ